MKRITQFTALLTFCIFGLFLNQSNAQLSILSGKEGGTYFFLSNDIAKHSSQPLEVVTSSGSMENFNKLVTNPNTILAFIQYDVLIANELVTPSLRKDLNLFLPLFLDEEIHLITRKNSKINCLEDLKGKKVGVGTIEEGTHVTAQTIKNKTSINWTNVEISTEAAYDALMKGEIDAYFYVVGAPAKSFLDLDASSDIKLVPIAHKNLKDIYKKKVIKKGTYAWLQKDITTMAIPALLVIKIKDLSLENEKMVNQLLADIKANVDLMAKEGHPKWKFVYYQNQEITWPYYYVRAKVE